MHSCLATPSHHIPNTIANRDDPSNAKDFGSQESQRGEGPDRYPYLPVARYILGDPTRGVCGCRLRVTRHLQRLVECDVHEHAAAEDVAVVRLTVLEAVVFDCGVVEAAICTISSIPPH